MSKRHSCSICDIRLTPKDKRSTVSFSCTDEQHAKYKAAAQEANMTMASLVRHALHEAAHHER